MSEAPTVATTTAAELIEHLERGGLIARGDPRHIQFIRFELYSCNDRMCKHLGLYGWGSALTKAEEALKDVLYEPHTWVKVDAIADGKSEDYEQAASRTMSEAGHWDEDRVWEWVSTKTDSRPVNSQ